VGRVEGRGSRVEGARSRRGWHSPLATRHSSLLLLLAGIVGFAMASPGAIPDNDNFATRIPLFGTNVTTSGSNAGATMEPGEPDPSFEGGKSVWWTWTAPADSSLTVSTAGSTFDTMVSVFTGNVLSNLTLVAFNDTETNTSLVTFNVSAGTAYQIAVDGLLNATGSITLNLTIGPTQPPPPNDNFANRITLTGTHLSNVTGSNVGATKEEGEPFHADEVGGKSIWWTWTAPSSGGLTLTTLGSSFDTILAVYTGTAVSNLTFVAGNDEDALNKFGYTSRVTCNVTAGMVYQIAIDGYDDDSGDIRMQLDLGSLFPVPANDNFSNRIAITGSSTNVTGSNVGASFEAVGADFLDGEPEHLVTFGGKSVWWSWTAPSSGYVTLTTSNSTFDTIVCVYTGTNLTNLVFVAGNDEDFFNPTGFVSRVTFNATNGRTYQIVVDGYDGDSGTINMQLRKGSLVAAPANDNFANRILLSGNSVTTSGSTLGATFEVGEPLPNNSYGGKSAWWQWVSPGPGIVSMNTIGSDFDTILAVYTGASVSNLTQVASDDESGGNYTSLLTFYTKSGVTNYIAVDGYDGDSGTVSLHLSFTQASYSLTINTNPALGGSVSISPLPDQSGKYAPDSVVTLTASGVGGYVFTNWTGSITNTNNPVSLTMNANKTISAGFFLSRFTLAALQPQTAQSIQTDGFRLFLSGPTNLSYALDRSMDLTNWTSVQTSLVTFDPFEFQDTTASNAPLGFYRARLVP
jgi:hypothetical protein